MSYFEREMMRMNNKKMHTMSLVFALLASAIFGMSFMFSKLALEVAKPTVLLAFRFAIAFGAMSLAILVNAIVGKVRGKALFAFSLKGKPVGSLVLLGLIQPVLYFFCENYGILYTSSAVAGTIIAVVPIACILMDVLVLHEKVTRRQVICAVLCIGGVALIYMGGETHISLLGLLLLLMTVGCDAAYYTLSHRAAEKFTAFEVTYVMFTVGMAFFIPAALIQGAGHMAETFLPAMESGAFWGAVIYLGLVSSVVAYFLLNFATARLTVSEASLFSNVTTVVSVLAGVVLLRESFGLWQVAGAALILVCVYAANAAPKKKA